ncbi:LysR family transcriptional regulator [Nocardia anaemiae]|uniref:LysR family transcriptional regulator n=1 Tax=Nocardia anaemiae TaxID=263910 RepID=UPI0007A48EB7|nr:LysR family transcriptional regulator [Nocardia anaemiae]
MIDLRRLAVLRVLAERGTVTAAATDLHVTPSAVSQQLRSLASELGVQLVVRRGRNIELTPAARSLLAHVDDLSARWEHARADIASANTTLTGQLRLCGVSSAAAALLLPAAARLHSDHPELDVHIRELESGECFQQLLAYRSDIALVLPAHSPPVDDPRFEQQAIFDDAQDLLVPEDHPLTRRSDVRLADAATESWIVKPENNDSYELLVAACAAAGFTPRVTHHLKEWFAVSAAVAQGFGVCLLPRLVPVPERHRTVRVPLHGNIRPARAIIAATRRGSREHPMIAAGMHTITAVADELALAASRPAEPPRIAGTRPHMPLIE